MRSLAFEHPTEGVISLCTALKSKGLECGLLTLAEDFPSAELVPEPAVLDGVVDPTSPYGPSKAPALWAEVEFQGAVVLAEAELNLRYVAVTRAEGECVSPVWTAPMFSEHDQYRQWYPGCLLLSSLEQVVVRQGKEPQEDQFGRSGRSRSRA